MPSHHPSRPVAAVTLAGRALGRRRALGLGAATFLLLPGLAACQSAPPPPEFPVPRFTDRPPFRFAVAVVDVVTNYRAPGREPFVEHRFAVSPVQAAESWARDRIVAAGSRGSLTLFIEEGEVRETKLKTQRGLPGVFTDEQSERYDGVLTVRIAIEGAGDGSRNGSASASARQSRTVPESFSVDDRRRAWHEMTRELVEGLDREMELRFRNELRSLLVG